MSHSNQLFLLADHIKLSLLERQRAISLNLESHSQDGHTSRSLEALRDGLESLSKEQMRLEETGDLTAASKLRATEENLQIQYNDLISQFHSFPNSTASATISHPNDPRLADDFARASERPQVGTLSPYTKKSLRSGPSMPSPKSVRFSDVPKVPSVDAEEAASRAALFPYRDEPTSELADQSELDNQQIHAYHSQVIAEQDEQLDRLGESIRRQGELSIQIGDELDSHVQLLDEVDGMVDRHQSRLDKARKSLGNVARKANDNKQLTIIFTLIVILVLLIIIRN